MPGGLRNLKISDLRIVVLVRKLKASGFCFKNIRLVVIVRKVELVCEFKASGSS